MNALLIILPALLMILIVVGGSAWHAYQQVRFPSNSGQTEQVPQPVSTTPFVMAMLILMALAILVPLAWLYIAFATSPYAL
jgi:uncharacterized iron-regulated membrane protein